MVTVDCETYGALVLSYNGPDVATVLVGDDDPPTGQIFMSAGVPVVVPCKGVVNVEFTGTGSVSAYLSKDLFFPYQSALMGLAGLLAGSLFAVAISRVGRGKGGLR